MSDDGPWRPVSLDEIRRVLEAEVLSGEDRLSDPVARADATDLMSQVLAFARPGTILLTGLINIQVVHTAMVAELSGLVFVRGLRPAEEVIARGRSLSLPMLLTSRCMYRACGLLYNLGLPGLLAP
jgi:xanthine dehydrogenase iron-sulfur cluster and FAD-binding subunit A